MSEFVRQRCRSAGRPVKARRPVVVQEPICEPDIEDMPTPEELA
jgi:hypothetical protein